MPAPSLSVEVPTNPLLGASLTLTLTFDNAGPATGYGPYIDLFLPLSGADGQGGGGPDDGISFASADYLGLHATTNLLDCPAGSTVTHPLTAQATPCPAQPPGLYSPFVWQMVVVTLPFGSFVPDQPPAPVTVSANLSNYADVDVALPVRARGGFMFGTDPLDNPSTDPPIQGSIASATITPNLLTLSKSYDGPEDETATGPNYIRRYTLSLSKPSGIPLSGVHLIDDLFSNMAYHGGLSCSPGGYSVVRTPTLDAAANPPDNRLDVLWPSVAGSTTTLTCTFTFFTPLRDANNGTVIDPDSGDDVTSCNQASAAGSWNAADPRDSGGPFSVSPAGCEHDLNDRSIAIQKSVSVMGGGAPAPGRVLQYTLNFQVSDFFAFQNLVITDAISDGQHFDPEFMPTLQINGNTYTLPGASMQASNVETACNYTGAVASPPAPPGECDSLDPAPNDGSTTLVFFVSQEIIARGQDGRLIGGCVPAGGTGGPDPDCGTYNDGPTTGTIVFRTIVQEDFTDAYPSGDRSVDQGDRLNDSVTVEGELLSPSDAITPTGQNEDDTSAALANLAYGSIAKSIYAVNGSTSFSTPVRVSPGDTVTYRVAYSLPTSDFEDLVITDYLPLPIYSASEVSTFSNTICGIPAAGVSCLGPADTYHLLPGAVMPSFSTSAGANSLTWAYGDYDAPANPSSSIDLLFTVAVRSDPFADGLFLTNQAYAQEGSTNSGSSVSTGIVQVQLQEPLVSIRKGVVWTDNPNGVFAPSTVGPVIFDGAAATCAGRLGGLVSSSGLAANPVDSNLSDVDAGDQVMVAIVLENTGRYSAFDVRVRDSLPDGMTLVPGSVCVTDGTGAAFTITDLGGGLFGSGLELDDPGPTDPPAGALDPGRAGDGSVLDSGRNIAIITYLVTLDDDVSAGASLLNTATLYHYANTEGGPDFTGNDRTDTAEVRVRSAGLGKVFTSEIINEFNMQAQAVIGELVTYALTVTVPEGQMTNVTLEDTLPTGLAFVDCLSITPSSADVTTDLAGGFAAACNDPFNPAVSSPGRTFTFTLGTITNANRDNSQGETIAIEFSVVTLNVASNQAGTTLRNTAWLVIDGGAGGIATVQSAALTVIEPTVNTTKSVLPATADAGDTLTFTVTLANPASGSTTAHDVTWADTIPSGLTYVPGSLRLGSCAAATPPALSDADEGMLIASGGLFQPGQSCQILFQATVDYSVSPGQVITNLAQTRWTSLSGDMNDRSPYNDASDERTGEDGLLGSGVLNDYRTQGSAIVTIAFTPQKSIVSTSEAHTGLVGGYERLVVGEIVRYRLVVQWPEGTAPEAMLRDYLPTGLQFLDEDPPVNTRVAFVCNGSPACMTSSVLGSGPVVNGNETTVGGVTPAYVLPDGSVSSSPTTDDDSYGSGTDPYFKFGNLFNSDDDGDQEFIVLEFNALVLNIGGNQGGIARDDRFIVRINGVERTPASNTLRIYVAEPTLTLSKAVVTTPGDAGDPVTYSLVISAATGVNSATAFDLNLTDAFDSSLTDFAVGSVTTTQGATCVGNGGGTIPFSHNGGSFTGNTLTFTATCLDPGSSITITVTATVVSDVPAGYTIPNTANLSYTSLPGRGTSPNPTGAVTPGAPGSGTGERTGNDGVGGALNDYAATASALTDLTAPAIDKRAPTPASAPIGATVAFPILVILPEGITQDLVVTDDLPHGLVYVGHSVVATAAGSGGLLAADYSGTLPVPTVTAPGGSGDDITFDFGDVTAAADNVTNNNAFVVFVSARLNNESGNQNGTTLSNIARLTYADPESGSTDIPDPNAEDVTVLEPELEITKSADDTTPAHGQTLAYTLNVSHLPSSTATAYDIVVSDTVPIGLSYLPGSISAPAGWATDDASAPSLTWTCSSPCALPLGTTAVLTYQVTVNGPPGPPNPGDILTNITSMTWTSLDGADPNERTGEGGVNDYADSDGESITLTAVDLRIRKDDGGISSTAGGVIPYTLNYANVGNSDATGVAIAETVPANTTFNAGASTPGWSCADGSPAGTACTLVIGDLAARGSGAATFAVRVNNPLPSGVTHVENEAAVSDDGTHGVDADPADNNDSDDTPVDAAPDTVIAKDDGMTVVSPKQVVTYTLIISNVGTQDATGVVVTDAIPPGTTFLSASDGGTYDSGTGLVTWPSFSIAAGSPPISRTVTIQVDDPFPGSSMTNAAHVEDDGSNGPDLNPADNDGEDTDRVLTIPNTDLTKALAGTNQGFTPGSSVAVGEMVTYEIAFTAPAGGTLPDVTLADVLDRGLAFVGCLSISASDPAITTTLSGGFDAACNDPLNPTVQTEPPESTNPADPARRITYRLGDVSNTGANDGTVTVRYQVVVLDVIENQDGVGNLSNSATLTWASGSLSASASDVAVVEPDLELQKTVDRTLALPGSILTFTLTFRQSDLSNVDAFDVLLSDTLPGGLTYVPGSLAIIRGPPGGVSDDSAAPTLRVRWPTIPMLMGGEPTEAVVQFQATLGSLSAGQSVTNTSFLEWSSLPGDFSSPQSPYNATSTERYYDPGSNVDVYGVSARVTITVPPLPATGFAPGTVTHVAQSSRASAYADLGDLWLEIPSLGVRTPVVGIPARGDEWDLSWLWGRAGWLEGTAYPTRPGNSALTAHLYLPNGLPGPFVHLGSLRWGDRIVVHAGGLEHLYEVRQVMRVRPQDLAVLRHETYPWLTLLTCEGYNPAQDTYRWRVAVRAVLVEVR